MLTANTVSYSPSHSPQVRTLLPSDSDVLKTNGEVISDRPLVPIQAAQSFVDFRQLTTLTPLDGLAPGFKERRSATIVCSFFTNVNHNPVNTTHVAVLADPGAAQSILPQSADGILFEYNKAVNAPTTGGFRGFNQSGEVLAKRVRFYFALLSKDGVGLHANAYAWLCDSVITPYSVSTFSH